MDKQMLKRYRAAVAGATKKDKRAAVRSVLQYGYADRRTIEFKELTDPKGMGMSFHSLEHWSYMTRDEALRLLGFSWKKLGM